MFWFGLFHLLGGIGMIIPGFIILLSESNDCPSPYIFNSGQCCTYSNGYDNNLNSCYSPPASVPGLALTSAGAASGIVGMFLLIWACRFYRNNNNTCCPCCWMILFGIIFLDINVIGEDNNLLQELRPGRIWENLTYINIRI